MASGPSPPSSPGSDEDHDDHPTGGSGGGKKESSVPSFLRKTYNMLEDPECHEFIKWGDHNNSLIILKLAEFSEIVLPKYFKHNNYASFVRQLNIYGFKKIGELSSHREFGHPMFVRGNLQLAANIKRNGTGRVREPTLMLKRNREKVDTALDDMVELKRRQQVVEASIAELRLSNLHMKRENDLLWNELNQSRVRQNQMRMKMRRLLLLMFEMYRTVQRNTRSIGGPAAAPPPDVSSHPMFVGDSILTQQQVQQALSYLGLDSPMDPETTHNTMLQLADASGGFLSPSPIGAPVTVVPATDDTHPVVPLVQSPDELAAAAAAGSIPTAVPVHSAGLRPGSLPMARVHHAAAAPGGIPTAVPVSAGLPTGPMVATPVSMAQFPSPTAAAPFRYVPSVSVSPTPSGLESPVDSISARIKRRRVQGLGSDSSFDHNTLMQHTAALASDEDDMLNRLGQYASTMALQSPLGGAEPPLLSPALDDALLPLADLEGAVDPLL